MAVIGYTAIGTFHWNPVIILKIPPKKKDAGNKIKFLLVRDTIRGNNDPVVFLKHNYIFSKINV